MLNRYIAAAVLVLSNLCFAESEVKRALPVENEQLIDLKSDALRYLNWLLNEKGLAWVSGDSNDEKSADFYYEAFGVCSKENDNKRRSFKQYRELKKDCFVRHGLKLVKVRSEQE